MSKEFSYNVDPDFNFTIDEKGNSFISLRKIQWNNKGDYRLDLRKYISTENGEQMGKGVSFLTEEGPGELAKVLIENGYGDAEELATAISEKREDILKRLAKKLSDGTIEMPDDDSEDETDEKLYNPEEMFE